MRQRYGENNQPFPGDGAGHTNAPFTNVSVWMGPVNLGLAHLQTVQHSFYLIQNSVTGLRQKIRQNIVFVFACLSG